MTAPPGNHLHSLRQSTRRRMGLIVRRVRRARLALFTNYSYHGITDREGTPSKKPTTADYAEVENAIRDLKYGVGGTICCRFAER